MATTQNSPLLSSDLQAWYQGLNTIISNYGGGMATLAVPSANKKAETADANDFFNKLTAMKADAYLKYASYPVYSLVNQNELIMSGTGTAMFNATTATYLGAVKCRNTATNSSGTCSNVTKSNVTKSNVTKSNGSHSSGSQSSGKHSSGNESSGGRSHGTNGVANSFTSFNWDHFNQTNNFGSNHFGSVGAYISYSPEGSNNFGSQSNGNHGNGSKSNGNKSNGNKSNVSKSDGTHSSGTHSSGTHSSGTNSKGTVIDIFCSNSTKANYA